MPKNKGKGGKNRRRGKNENDFMKRELDKKEPGQEYGQVIKMLGNGRVQVFCFDGQTRICHIRGKLRKKVWINTGDIILIGLRDYQDEKADVILKYTPDEARRLKADGELPENARINENDEKDEGEIVFRDMGGADGADSEDESDDDLPSSGDDESEEEGEETEKKVKEKVMNKKPIQADDDDDDSDEDDSDESDSDNGNFLTENDLAAGRGLGGRGGGGGRGRGGKNKYGKRR